MIKNMLIEKIATREGFNRKNYYFDRARDGFKALLQNQIRSKDECVLLPSFIGLSPKEGSGVFDPIREVGVDYEFYALDEKLHINIDSLKIKLSSGNVKIVVVIHYFGHVDPNYLEIIKLVRLYNCIILEDEAHALFTDIIDGKSGRLGDACIYSLHKMLPVKEGGVLVLNNNRIVLDSDDTQKGNILYNYDLFTISSKRKKNTRFLKKILADVKGVRLLWNDIATDETLQTLPVIIENFNRNRLYEIMNEQGFGVVTLYHTMINNISEDEFPVSYEVARRIINLPIHQDVNEEELRNMVELLKTIIK